MAGFQLSINGRFWVSTEVQELDLRREELHVGVSLCQSAVRRVKASRELSVSTQGREE